MLRLMSGLILVTVLAVAGCRTAPLYNATDVNFASPASTSAARLTLDDYRNAIIRGGAKRGWTFEDAGPGHLVGSVTVRGKHHAKVDVMFDTEQFSITHKASQNLNYNPSRQQIHPNYNSWVSNLQQEIQAEITLMQAG
ncbi:MAG TPA: hypothetical protein VMM59_11485 [Thermohalobaculum sp.]|nr:hypothetical protein [Thermohalobaculum sp.]